MEDNKVSNSFKRVLVRFAFIFLLIILFLTFFSKSINRMLLPQVTTYVPSDKTISNTTMFSVSILYENTAKAYPEYSHFIDKVLIKENSIIKIGTPIAKLRQADINNVKDQFEIDILTLEDSLKNKQEQLDSRYLKDEQKEAIQRQIDILNIQLSTKLEEQKLFASTVDENNNLLSTVEGKVLNLYFNDRSYCTETTALFEYINDSTYPVLQWELTADKASLFNESSRVSVEFDYMESDEDASTSETSSRNLSVDSKTYNYNNGNYIYTVNITPSDTELLSAYKISVTLSNKSMTLSNAVPVNAVIASSDTEGVIYILELDELTGKYYAKEVSVNITSDSEAYYGIDYEFQRNQQIILSSTKPLSNKTEVRLR